MNVLRQGRWTVPVPIVFQLLGLETLNIDAYPRIDKNVDGLMAGLKMVAHWKNLKALSFTPGEARTKFLKKKEWTTYQ